MTKKVVITGGCGNLGTKLATHLLLQNKQQQQQPDSGYTERENEENRQHQQQEQYWSVCLLEHPDYHDPNRIPQGAEIVLCDLANEAKDAVSWKKSLDGAYALVHFSAVNPYPSATWNDSSLSMTQTFNVFLAAAEHGVQRVLFASSNHVMGGYKDIPSAGMVKPNMPPLCGTKVEGQKSDFGVAYAAAKLAGEQLCRSLSCTSPNTSFVVLRIGWCQPGVNHPSTLRPDGEPSGHRTTSHELKEDSGTAAEVSDNDFDWFRGMWLSNNDFLTVFTAALDMNFSPEENNNFAIMNAMSKNRNARWSLDETEELLGVELQDDCSRF